MTFNVTPATASMTVGLVNSGNGNWSWFDDFSIKEKVPVVTEVVNGDFENGLTGWSNHFNNGKWGSYAAGEENDVARSIDWNGDPLFQVVEVEPGTTYTVRASMLQGAKGSGMIVIEGAGMATSQLSAAAYYYFGNDMDNFNATLLDSYIAEASLTEAVTAELEVTPTQNTIMIAFANPVAAYFYVDDVSVEWKTDIKTVGTQISSNGDALRFRYQMNASGVTMDATTHVRGELADAKMYIEGIKRTVTDFGVMLNVSGNATEKDLSVGTANASSAKIPAAKLTSLDEDGTIVYVARQSIPEGYEGRVVSARAYVEYVGDGGVTKYYYTEIIGNSIESVQQKLAELENA